MYDTTISNSLLKDLAKNWGLKCFKWKEYIHLLPYLVNIGESNTTYITVTYVTSIKRDSVLF